MTFRRGSIIAMLVAVLVVVAGGLLIHPIDRISPAEMTTTRFFILEVRIRDYVKENGRAPTSIDELPPLENRDNALTDGWGRPIHYSVVGTAVTLQSHGADGQPGGVDVNRDMTHAFDLAKDPFT